MDEKYRYTGSPPAKLIEECAEVIESCSKVIHITAKGFRFGWKKYHPDDQEQAPNWLTLKREIKDLEEVIKNAKIWLEIIQNK